jgi:hypothetical protein
VVTLVLKKQTRVKFNGKDIKLNKQWWLLYL